MTMKKVVHYQPQVLNLSVGYPTYVQPVDHPSPLVSNKTFARTSNVIRIGANGEFETANTIYRVFRPS